jgi:hypothetical protein
MKMTTEPKDRVSEYFYTMRSKANGAMTVAFTDRDLMIADRELALCDPDKSEVSELQERECRDDFDIAHGDVLRRALLRKARA